MGETNSGAQTLQSVLVDGQDDSLAFTGLLVGGINQVKGVLVVSGEVAGVEDAGIARPDEVVFIRSNCRHGLRLRLLALLALRGLALLGLAPGESGLGSGGVHHRHMLGGGVGRSGGGGDHSGRAHALLRKLGEFDDGGRVSDLLELLDELIHLLVFLRLGLLLGGCLKLLGLRFFKPGFENILEQLGNLLSLRHGYLRSDKLHFSPLCRNSKALVEFPELILP